MSVRTEGKPRRRHRGRPQRPSASGRGAPTRTRLLALRVLERVQRSSAYADVLLNAHLGRSPLAAADRAFVTDLVNGTLRWRGKLDYLISQVLDRELDKLEPLVANALRLGAYQIVCTNRVPDSAAVDQTVRCVRAAGGERATGLVNAVLRRLAREHARIALPSLDRDPLEHLSHALSLPTWLATRWLEAYGPEAAAALAHASNDIPPLTVRVNRLRADVPELLEDVRHRFPDAAPCRFAEYGLVLGRRGNPAIDPGFLGGRFTVQDEASQLVVALLDPAPGERIVDTCAAPGGKATAIAERLGGQGEVLALDRHERRLELVQRHARRLGLRGLRTATRDATRSLRDLAGEGAFDRVLVDTPCSGIGTLRRNPDLRWRLRPGDVERLAETQRAVLRHAAELLRPEGVLVYSTCTLLHEENEDVVNDFLRASPDFRLSDPAEAPNECRQLMDSDGFLRTFPHVHDTDGFFAARLVRRP